jgi:hypothetical protein
MSFSLRLTGYNLQEGSSISYTYATESTPLPLLKGDEIGQEPLRHLLQDHFLLRDFYSSCQIDSLLTSYLLRCNSVIHTDSMFLITLLLTEFLSVRQDYLESKSVLKENSIRTLGGSMLKCRASQGSGKQERPKCWKWKESAWDGYASRGKGFIARSGTERPRGSVQPTYQ